jgi:hypothetical protein
MGTAVNQHHRHGRGRPDRRLPQPPLIAARHPADLALLSIPTALLAVAPDLTTFMILRIVQGLFMAAAFTLTLTYLAEQCSARDAATASAAYITGNVASNLFGRLMSAALADHLGLATNFYVFAGLNLAGALLVYVTLAQTRPMAAAGAARSSFAIWAEHLRNGPLRASFGIGFLILFAFIGTFTFVNFVLVGDPLAVSPMQLGFVYLVFLPSILTTPLAGRGAAPGHAADLLGRAGGGRCRPAAPVAAEPPGGAGGPGAGGRGHLLRTGGGDRLHRPGRDHRPRLRQRHLSRLLLLRRHRRHGRARPTLRPAGMDRLRHRHRRRPRPSLPARAAAEDADVGSAARIGTSAMLFRRDMLVVAFALGVAAVLYVFSFGDMMALGLPL